MTAPQQNEQQNVDKSSLHMQAHRHHRMARLASFTLILYTSLLIVLQLLK